MNLPQPEQSISKSSYKFAIGLYVSFALYAFYLFYEIGLFVAQNYVKSSLTGFSIDNPNFFMWNRVLALVLTAVSLLIMYSLDKFKAFIVEVGDELTRVSWTSIKETQKSTVIIIVMCVVTAIFLFLADQLFLKVMNYLLSFGI